MTKGLKSTGVEFEAEMHARDLGIDSDKVQTVLRYAAQCDECGRADAYSAPWSDGNGGDKPQQTNLVALLSRVVQMHRLFPDSAACSRQCNSVAQGVIAAFSVASTSYDPASAHKYAADALAICDESHYEGRLGNSHKTTACVIDVRNKLESDEARAAASTEPEKWRTVAHELLLNLVDDYSNVTRITTPQPSYHEQHDLGLMEILRASTSKTRASTGAARCSALLSKHTVKCIADVHC